MSKQSVNKRNRFNSTLPKTAGRYNCRNVEMRKQTRNNKRPENRGKQELEKEKKSNATAPNNNDCAYSDNEDRSLNNEITKDLRNCLHEIDHRIVKVELESILTDIKKIEDNAIIEDKRIKSNVKIIKEMFEIIALGLRNISGARFFVSGYKNTDKVLFRDFFSGTDEGSLYKSSLCKPLYKNLCDVGSKEFGLSPSSPFGLLEFSEVFENKYLMQINLDCKDDEKNGALRFYIVQRCTRTGDERPDNRPKARKKNKILFYDERTVYDNKTGKQYEQLCVGRDLLSLCRNIQTVFKNDIKTIISNKGKDIQVEKAIKLIEALKNKINHLVKPSAHPDGEIYAVIVARNKDEAKKALSIFLDSNIADDENQGLSNKSHSFWMSNDNDSPVAVFPMSCQMNQDRLTHLIYFNYLLFKILPPLEQEKTKMV